MTSLLSLAAEINAEHEAVKQAIATGLEHARRAGELLHKAKAAVPHGAWLPWLAEHCEVSPRMAQNYMRIAAEWATLAKTKRVSYLPVRRALKQLNEPHRSPPTTWSKEQEWDKILRALRPARDLATNWPDDRDFEQFIHETRNLLTYLEQLQSQYRAPDPMATRPALVIDHGPVAPSQQLREVPPERWRELVSVRRSFAAVHLKYDCRELLRFVKEAADMLGPLGYADVPDFIRRGLELDPAMVEWATEGLRLLKKLNERDEVTR